MVAGTAAAVGVALVNDRRLSHVLVEPSSIPAVAGGAPAIGLMPNRRTGLGRRFAVAALCSIAVLAMLTFLPAVTALATSLGESEPLATRQGPASDLRAAAGVSGGQEQAYSLAVPAGDALGAAVLAGTVAQRDALFLANMEQIWVEQQAQAAAAPATAPRESHVAGASTFSGGPPVSLAGASGYAIGTILSARITVYGCTGPGGGFCGNMASGIQVFEGAAACSRDLPFGTRIRIDGDPTGRIYECLDRGALSTSWVDVFFNNTSEGIAWASMLGGTTANIEIVN